MNLKTLLLVLAPFSFTSSEGALSSREPDELTWQRAVTALEHVDREYEEALETTSDGETHRMGDSLRATAAELSAAGAEPAWVQRMETLSRWVLARQHPEDAAPTAAHLAGQAARLGNLEDSPSQAPDLERGRVVFSQACANCHGPQGNGPPPAMASLSPPPASFHKSEVMNSLSPRHVFNIVSVGIAGSAMPGWHHDLSRSDRWAVAFYVMTLRMPECTHAPMSLPANELAGVNDRDLVLRYGVSELACLRRSAAAARW